MSAAEARTSGCNVRKHCGDSSNSFALKLLQGWGEKGHWLKCCAAYVCRAVACRAL